MIYECVHAFTAAPVVTETIFFPGRVYCYIWKVGRMGGGLLWHNNVLNCESFSL